MVPDFTLVFGDDRAPVSDGGRQVNEWLDDCDQVFARAFSSGALRWIHCLGLGVFAFSASSRVVTVWPEPDAEHDAIIETFSRIVAPLILQDMGWQALHAGAVAGPSGVLAFCGRSGSGKSTLAFAMELAGYRQVADDVLMLRLDQERVMSRQLPFKPRLRPDSLAYFAHMRPAPSFSGPQIVEIPLSAIYLLQQNETLNKPRLSLLPQARAFSEVLAQAECFDAENPRYTRRLVESYLELAARVPVYSLKYRPSFQHLSNLCGAIMETVGACSSSFPRCLQWACPHD
jgi:hypothetical protein